MEGFFDTVFSPLAWIWTLIAGDSLLSASLPVQLLILVTASMFLLVTGVGLLAMCLHWLLLKAATWVGELLREQAMRGSVERMLALAVRARRIEGSLFSLASKTGVRPTIATNRSSNEREIAGAENLGSQGFPAKTFTALVISIGALFDLLAQIGRAAVTSPVSLYMIIGSLWTLRPEWIDASMGNALRWASGWDLPLVATVLGLVTAYAFSPVRRAKHKSMSDELVVAEDTLARLGPRAEVAAVRVGDLVCTAAAVDRRAFADEAEKATEGQLTCFDATVEHLHRRFPMLSNETRKDHCNRLDRDHSMAMEALAQLNEATAEVETLYPYARLAGRHGWALLLESYPSPFRKSSPRGQVPPPSLWPALDAYEPERYEERLNQFRAEVTLLAKREESLDELTGVVQGALDGAHWSCRQRIWSLAELYAVLFLGGHEIRRSRHLRGIRGLLARFVKN